MSDDKVITIKNNCNDDDNNNNAEYVFKNLFKHVVFII